MEKAKDILIKYFKMNEGIKNNKYSNFFKEWEKIIGKKLYGHSKIIDIKKNSVYIEVDHPGWMQLVLLIEKKIIRRINKLYPTFKIKHLNIKVREEKYIGKIESVKEKDIEMTKNEEFLEKIHDKRLKNVLKRLYIKLFTETD